MAYNWVDSPNWINPTTPVHTSGMAVIESDDGNSGTYAWFPIFKRVAAKHSDWFPSSIVCCPNLNTGVIGVEGALTVEQVKELSRNFWEMNSHGKYHVGLGLYKTSASVEVGATVIPLAGFYMPADTFQGYTFRIWDGTNGDEFSLVSLTGQYDGGEWTITPALTHAYNSNANVQITQASALELLNGAKDDLDGWGIPCRHHVFTYHAGSDQFFSQDAIDWASSVFSSGRGLNGSVNTAASDLPNLKSKELNASTTTAAIDTILDDISASDKVGIFYGHGETTAGMATLLEHLIDGCVSRGILITTRQRAYEELLSR